MLYRIKIRAKHYVIEENLMKVANFKMVVCNPSLFPFDRCVVEIDQKPIQVLTSFDLGWILVYWGNRIKKFEMDDFTNYDGNICDFLEARLLEAPEWDKEIIKSMLEKSLYRGSILKKAKVYVDDPEQIKLF